MAEADWEILLEITKNYYHVIPRGAYELTRVLSPEIFIYLFNQCHSSLKRQKK